MSVLWVCFDAHRPDGKVWAVRVGNRWLRSGQLRLHGAWITRYRPGRSQPVAYLQGVGYVRRRRRGWDVYSEQVER
jgi:hypothetical protein